MISKEEIRKKIWYLLEEKNIALFPRPVFGRIPNFKGADVAAKRLSMLSEFISAEVIKVSPDSPQRWVREIALRQGTHCKTLKYISMHATSTKPIKVEINLSYLTTNLLKDFNHAKNLSTALLKHL